MKRWILLGLIAAGLIAGVARGAIKVLWVVWGVVALIALVVLLVSLALLALLVVLPRAGKFKEIIALPFAPLVYWLADRDLFFVYRKEATARIILRGDAFEKPLIHWKDYILDVEGNVIEGDVPSSIWADVFGVEPYGLWPFLHVGVIHLRWRDLQETEKGEYKPKFHEEDQGWVHLRAEQYWIKVEAAETKPPERIPLTVGFIVTMRALNPYRVVFVAPVNWTENTMLRLSTLLRSYIASKTLDELLEAKATPDGVWGDLGQELLIQQTLKKEWGVEVLERGIEIREITLSDEYQQAAAAERTAKMRAAAARERIQIEWQAIQQFGDLGRLIRTLEALERSEMAATVALQVIPGLPQVLQSAFGKPPEQATLEEIAALRQEIQELSRRIGGGGRRP